MIQRLITVLSLFIVAVQIAACSDQTVATGKLATDVATVGIQVKGAQRKLKINEQVVLPISIHNNGVSSIPSQSKPDGAYKVNATYHWRRAGGEMAIWDGVRTALPADIKSGKTIDVSLIIKAPQAPGAYLLVIDLVQEGVLWFADTGSQTATLAYTVQ